MPHRQQARQHGHHEKRAHTVAEAKLEVMANMAKFFKHQLFLASLSKHLCEKVLEVRKDNFAQSLELAQELEAIQL
jgi:hypothetical protein